MNLRKTLTAVLPALIATILTQPAHAAFANTTLTIVGSDQLGPLMSRLNALFIKSAPLTAVQMNLKGSSVALNALATGAATIAPLGRLPWLSELNTFKAITGHPALLVPVAYAGWGPNNTQRMPPAIYINRENPISALSMDQLARIFTTGQNAGDIEIWSQVNVSGPLGKRHIHIYGAADDGRTITALRTSYFHHTPFAPSYENLDSDEAAITAVADDHAGIALGGWMNNYSIPATVRILPLLDTTGTPSSPDQSGIGQGRYPLRQYVFLAVDPNTSLPNAAATCQFVRTALSDDGQRAVSASISNDNQILPLSPAERDLQRMRIEKTICAVTGISKH
nr:substrate-binding domain-containing protein [uncultured Neokomagataea sp.]